MFWPPATPRPLPAVKVWDVVLLIVLFLAVGLVLGALQGPLAEAFGKELSQNGLVPILLLQSGSLILLVYLLIVVRRGVSWTDLGFRPADRAWYRIALAGGLLCVPLVALSRLLLEPLIGDDFQNPQLEVLGAGGFDWANLITLLVLVGLLVPFTEELLFRGLLYPLLRRRLSVVVAALLSAVCFALLHWIPPLVPAFTLMGIILAMAREYSGSLWPPLIIHSLFNCVNLITLYTALAMGQAG